MLLISWLQWAPKSEQILTNHDEQSCGSQIRVLLRKEQPTMKTLEMWNPVRELDEVQNRLITFFEGLPEFRRFPRRILGNGDITLPQWSPQVDISEDDKEYLVQADLPEMKKEDVKVTVEDNVLSISGQRKSEKEEKKKKFHRIERSHGTFLRTFTLPENADANKIVAEFKEGVLKVHLPKTPAAKPKSVEVKVQ
jgi:HSP20 family protein